MHSIPASVPQQVFGRLGEVLVEVPGEGGAGVVGEDADEHEGIILDIGPRVVVLLEIVAYHIGALLGSTRRGLGGVDDRWQINDLIFGAVRAT